PASPGADAGHFARALEVAIDGHTKYVDYALTRHEAGDEETSWHEWLCQQEFAHKQVVFDASGPATWTQTALRQADRVLVVVDAEQATPDPEAVARLRAAGLQAPVALVLLRRDARMPAGLGDWKAALCAESHFHLRADHGPDLASLGRQLTGHGVGLVLGGGGARGFAHVGLLRALAECHIPVDVCGGASMGAFVAALHASGRDLAAITDTLRDTFIRRHLLNDYRLPTVSLIAGKKFRRHLHALFGDVRIEHLPTPFYCVSTNLTHARSEVHHEGVLADWLAASMCIPGLAPPVGYQGGLLCDGAVINSLPTDVMQALGRGVIIASDVSTDGAIHAPQAQGPDPDFEAVYRPREDGGRVRIKDILFRTTSLSAESGTTYRAQRADLYLRMPVREVGTFDWRQLDAIIERGYTHAMQELPALASKLASE
ncbi:MAG: patatin-like phospholipase family protein, partial [Moraxellaceae bacterium]